MAQTPRSPRQSSKTEFLQIRITPEDKKRVEAVAREQFLDASTWARAVILRAVALADATERE